MNELQRIEWLDSLFWSPIQNGLTALATQHFLRWQFYGLSAEEQKKVFKTNVANCVLYQANEALISQSIVELSEYIKNEDKMAVLQVTIPDKAELRKHRIIISHPGNVRFKEKEVQKFYNERQHSRDFKAVRLWRTRQTILDRLKELGGSSKFPNEVTVQLGTVELIYSALSVTRQPNIDASSLEQVSTAVFLYFSRYQEELQKLAQTKSVHVKTQAR